ncbi:hypothetical protein ACH47C_10270 [Streptomyces rishiriensis]|uniref:hypothetical protein n=1 Tax=Streptomyces rishiriensis TaxID=68264 RepID=UPI0033D09014
MAEQTLGRRHGEHAEQATDTTDPIDPADPADPADAVRLHTPPRTAMSPARR